MQHIDIEKILRSRTERYIPRMAFNYLRRIIHESQINDILRTGDGMNPHDFIGHVLRELNVTYEIIGLQPLPADRRYIFASNHPFGGLDGMIIAKCMLDMGFDTGVVVNDMLMHIDQLRPLWIPVNKYGRQRSENSLSYEAAFASPTKQILTFPAGFCSRKEGGKVTDTEWRPRFVKDAVKYDRQIVPVYVEGQLSKRFYRIYSIRKMLHININIELLYLVDEMFRQSGKHIRIHFGTPIDNVRLSGNTQADCQLVRQAVYSLTDKLKK
ncbi:MAG: acyltransferase [Alistipes sp.]|nr:acyltransferase [Alistipes sp.]